MPQGTTESPRDVCRVYISYAREDDGLCQKLREHLALLERRGAIAVWDRRESTPGQSVDEEALTTLQQSNVVLVLVTAAFTASDLWEKELRPALLREEQNQLRVVPILAKPVTLDHPVFTSRTVLPSANKPVTSYADPEEGWAAVAEALNNLVSPAADASSTLTTEEMLSRVERVCRLNEPTADIQKRQSKGNWGAYLQVSKTERGRGKIFPVGVLPRTPEEADIDRFAHDVDAFYRVSYPRLESIVVGAGGKADQTLIDRAFDRGILVETFAEFSGEMDVSRYLSRQRGDLQNSPIYPPSLYVPQRARVLVGKVESEVPRVLDEVVGLLKSPQPQFLMVLADFGTGKTFLLRKIALSLMDSSIVPVRVELKTLDKAQSLDSMLAAHFMQSGERSFDRDQFRFMLEEGRIALLFDGFDELVQRLNYDRAGDHLETLMEAAQGRAKVVLTSRSQHFLSDAQAKEAISKAKNALASRVNHVPGVRFIKLLPFNEDEILEFLRNKLNDPVRAAERFALIRDVKDLLGLSHNPRMLSFIADVDEERMRAAKARRGDVTAATLYELILHQWLGYEVGRANPKGSPAGLDLASSWRALLLFSEHLWTTGAKTVDLAKLDPSLYTTLSTIGPSDMTGEEKVFAVGSGSLLVRNEEGHFSFVHRSVLEFLVAWNAASQLRGGNQAPRMLVAQPMSDLMTDFFVDEAGRPLAEEWAQRTLEKQGLENAKKNANLVLSRLGSKVRGAADMRNADLRGQDFTGRSLARADLSGSDLSSAKLVGADLSDAVLSNCRFIDADLTDANLQRADFTNSDLTRAELKGTRAEGTKWEGAVLYRTSFAGSTVNPATLSAARWQAGVAYPPPAVPSPHFDAAMEGCSTIAMWADILASAHQDSVHIWDAARGQRLMVLSGQPGRAGALSFANRGQFLLCGTDDHTILVFAIATGEPLFTLGSHGGVVNALAVHPDGRTLASAGSDGTVKLWDLNTRSGRVLGEHLGNVRRLLWTPDGSTLLWSSDGEFAQAWDAKTGVAETIRHEALLEPSSLAVSPDSKFVVGGRNSGRIMVWSVESKTNTGFFEEHPDRVTAVTFAPNGTTVASGDARGNTHVWDLRTGRSALKFSQTYTVTGLQFSSDGSALWTSTSDGTVRCFNPSTGTPLRTLSATKRTLTGLAVPSAGSTFAAAQPGGPVRIWDVRTCQTTMTSEGVIFGATALAFDPRVRFLAGGLPSGDVVLWGPDASQTRNIKAHAAEVTALTFTPNGMLLASGSRDGTVSVHSTETFQTLYSLRNEPAPITAMEWSPQRPKELFWGLANGALCSRLFEFDEDTHRLGMNDAPITDLTFHPSGALLSTSMDGVLLAWDVRQHATISTLVIGEGGILSVACSPQSGQTALGTHAGRVHLFDAEFKKMASLSGHASGVRKLAYHPLGNLLLVGAGDGGVHIWRLGDNVRVAMVYQTNEGWVAATPSGHYKLEGEVGDWFWHRLGLCRYDTGELDAFYPGIRKSATEPLFNL